MKFITKVVMFGVICLMAATFSSFVDSAIYPAVANSVAADQLSDSETAPVVVRLVSKLNNALPILSLFLVTLIGLYLFWGDIVRVINTLHALNNP